MVASPQLRQSVRCSIISRHRERTCRRLPNRLGAGLTLAVAIAFPAQAQIIVHGNDFPAGEATSTNYSFSIRFLISYNVEHKNAETRVGDVRHENKDGLEILSFSLSGRKQNIISESRAVRPPAMS
jgi:hypothetical protein